MEERTRGSKRFESRTGEGGQTNYGISAPFEPDEFRLYAREWLREYGAKQPSPINLMESKVEVLTSAQFSSSVGPRLKQFAWLLGAGASASAGIPTGYMMIRDFKTRLFCRETGLPRRELDPTDPLWMERIDEFFRKRSLLPPAGDPREYAAAFEAVFPTEGERRQYIEDAIRKGTASFGHRVLAALLSAQQISCVFTTNFDPLIETAATQTDQLLPAAARALPTVAALDSAERAARCLREASWPLIAKIHGDYKSIRQKNTTSELESQDEQMRLVLGGACQRFGLVVVGYSGRDQSLMGALGKAMGSPGAFPGGIYWVTRAERDLLPTVRELLDKASQSGISVAIVESQTFDELAGDIFNQAELPKVLADHVMEFRVPQVLNPTLLPTKAARKLPILRCTALLVNGLPTAARRLTLTTRATTATVRALLKEAKVYAVAASTGMEVAAFGSDARIVAALSSLGARVNGTMELRPDQDSWALGLLYDALTKALCRRRPLVARLRTAGHTISVSQGRVGEDEHHARARVERLARLQRAYSATLVGKVPNLGLPYAESIRIRLEHCADRWWCVFDPFTFVDFPREKIATTEEDDAAGTILTGPRPVDPAADWRRERWATRYNKVWNDIIDAWADLLSGPEDQRLPALGLEEGEGLDAVFEVSGATAWSRPAHHHPYFDRRR